MPRPLDPSLKRTGAHHQRKHTLRLPARTACFLDPSDGAADRAWQSSKAPTTPVYASAQRIAQPGALRAVGWQPDSMPESHAANTELFLLVPGSLLLDTAQDRDADGSDEAAHEHEAAA